MGTSALLKMQRYRMEDTPEPIGDGRSRWCHNRQGRMRLTLCAAILGVDRCDKAADKVIKCIDVLRKAGQVNMDKLAALKALIRSLGMELTELRVLGLLNWIRFGSLPCSGGSRL